MKRKHLIFVLICLLAGFVVHAQDLHFSQFFSTPLYTNPANTGNFEGDLRFVLNNKNQWMSFTNAYRTIAGTADVAFDNLFIEKSKAGLGLIINNDVAGDGKLGTNQFYLSTAYSIPITKNDNLRFGAGFYGGFVLHGINFNSFNFGNQYSGEQYDQNLPTGENWYDSRISYFDCGAGLNVQYSKDRISKAYIGLAASHINTPAKSFVENSDRFLPVKWVINAGLEYRTQDYFFVEPLFLAMFQQNYSEYNIGVLARLDYNPTNLQSIYFGVIARTSDAGIVCFGLKYRDVKFMINYDINLSNLSTISKGKGGVELSLIYIFIKPRPFNAPY
ncbi:MAG: PorP/SprF family type IX secretion system membrane protein, partial [Bacteroidales bacterium]|nr:PorP/SprF family type IX secretion system membrane protein [Bacteroidales bacterium]